ncbi:MAG: primase [Rickettsiaceae bacterium]|jgi:DNA primase|nr:primase [Rickettsiaceae bacterium]
MRIPLEFFEQLRQRLSVSQVVSSRVQLTRKGYEFSGLCPFHDEKSPSFTVNDIKRFYHCFGCGAHGDAIKFVSETSGIGYQEAAIKLAEANGIEIPKLSRKEAELYDEIDEIQKVLELANRFFTEQIRKKENKHIIDYLAKRGISAEQIQKFDIGYAPSHNQLQQFLESKKIPLMYIQKAGLIGKRENGVTYEIFRDRVTFPIKNIFDKTIAFGARALGSIQPKYLNSPETLLFKKNETLYGENKATAAAYKKNRMILVEGYIDAIAMQSSGYEETVASLGTAITTNHLSKLWKIVDEIIFCLDGDQAGLKATVKAIELALPQVTDSKTLSFVFLPEGLDPDELVKTKEKNFVENLIEKRLPLSEAIWHIETNDKNFVSAEHHASLEARLTHYTKSLKDQILSKNLYYFFKDQLWKLRQKKKKTNTQQTIQVNLKLPDHKISEIEHLEYAIFSYILKFPKSLTNDAIFETLNHLELHNKDIIDLREFIFENLDELINLSDDNTDKNLGKIEALFKNSRFSDLFILLSKTNSVFLDTQFLNSNKYSPEAIWSIVLKRYNLAIMKKEYITLLETYNEESFRKAQIYKKEIENIHLELEKYVLDNN